MMRRFSMVSVAGALALGICAGTGAATVLANTPPPHVRSLLLTAADFSSRASIVAQGTESTVAYRVLGPGLHLGSVRLLTVYSGVQVFGTAADAGALLASETRRQRRASARQRDVRILAVLTIGRSAKVGRITVGSLTSAGPDTSLWMAATTVAGSPIRIGVAEVRVDRAVAAIAVVSLLGGKLARRDTVRALSLARQRMRSAFVLDVKRPPVVLGVPFVGQVVNADEGEWAGGPSEFTYAWARCDAAGANCVEIPGATESRYTIDIADRGGTLRVTVQGRNTVSVRAGTSETTDVVT